MWITLTIGYAAAVLFFFARRLESRRRTAVLVLLSAFMLGSVILLRTGIEELRCLVAFILVIFLLHMWDLHCDPRRATRLSLERYMLFLWDYAWSVARTSDGYGVAVPRERRVHDAARCVGGLVLASVAAVVVFKIGWDKHSFLLEHVAKSTCLAAWLIWAFNANTALWRLAGAPAAFFTGGSVLGAYSPAEFWRRWNHPMHRWFLENIYKPLAGAGHSVLAVLLAFAVSGVLHEYLLAVTFNRVMGYVAAFFLLHGIAAALTRRLKPKGVLVVPAAVATLAFNTFSTVLLFIPINEAAPFYANDVPTWFYLW